MKEDRFNEKISAGYQSKILENAGWEDVSQMKVRNFFFDISEFKNVRLLGSSSNIIRTRCCCWCSIERYY
jgi:hypothetical protein